MSDENLSDLSKAFSNLLSLLTDDACFALSSGADAPEDALEGLVKRRTEAYSAVLQGVKVPRLIDGFDAWVVELTKAMVAVEPPVWMPMGEVLREKVTLEIGARGLRSLFSSKPSDKDVQRVRRLGSLAVRALRAVFAADGELDDEEKRTILALVASLGLPEADAAPLRVEGVLPVANLDVYGDMEPGVAKAVVRGAWLAAAWDAIDPREEEVVRTLGHKLGVASESIESARADAVTRIDARRVAGLAAVDAVRFMMSDRAPGPGVPLAAHIAALMLPRRYRNEALAQIGHGNEVVLAKRYTSLSLGDRLSVLGLAWAAALREDPTVSRKTMLRWRYDRLAADLSDDGVRARAMIEQWISESMASMARTLRGGNG